MKCKIINVTLITKLFIILLGDTLYASSLPETNDFHTYWYHNGAEISRFELEQGRYGEIHPGFAILLFVTEPFHPDKQVKADFEASREKSIPVLKLNAIKRFNTGIYDYSMMKSVFTPIPDGNRTSKKALKVSTTRQDWCGHLYLQYNLEGDAYNVLQHSYYEKEGDRSVTLPSVVLEDEIWTRIRIAPHTLPSGEMEMVPGSFYTTLSMIKIGAEKAFAKLTKIREENGEEVYNYSIIYPSLKRRLSIRFNQNFPYDIMSWDESYPDGSGDNTKVITTKARRTDTVMIDYWNRNKTTDIGLRDKLGLTK
ncbi:MAG: hypothetical protein D8M57_09245 [Candidatus Scalindua sp. AMX11]|nr:MAG: hypothetical protein DWQ00_00525 [Candidatus Scalindua sp.]NOG83023.1 hypothetical protein [Planctomycetota bacterium]RZV79575.1 MAG: hypothetical protein EX341_11115 [Candidatus Scalindua sp. SCAELEC01]TDE65215.1 MAG: hypothetical protein D8M57_09245 [Candidatus Scalindua sp. AMX11]GJQ58547.1 MAG: hypothetical protein SCALA701_13480 [Candidatus Scalindua sp.]